MGAHAPGIGKRLLVGRLAVCRTGAGGGATRTCHCEHGDPSERHGQEARPRPPLPVTVDDVVHIVVLAAKGGHRLRAAEAWFLFLACWPRYRASPAAPM